MLEGENVYLRPVETKDIDMFVELKSDFSSLEKLATKLSPLSSDAVSIWLKKAAESFEPLKFTIVSKSTKQSIGYIGFENINFIEGHSGFGFFIKKPFRGKGFGSEALNLLLEYGFLHLRLRRIYTEILENNLSSIKVTKKLGFVEEGRLRKQALRSGKYLDILIFGKLLEKQEISKLY